MPLPKLEPSTLPVQVQDTQFTTDAVARHVCNTFDEAVGSGGPAFSTVVVGAGAYGAYCAARIYRNNPAARVLLLDAGSFLIPEHVQNLGRIGLDVPAAIPPATDPGTARAVV
jgi:hypothetical protein